MMRPRHQVLIAGAVIMLALAALFAAVETSFWFDGVGGFTGG